MPNRAEIYSQIGDFNIWQLRCITALALLAFAAGNLGTVKDFSLLKPVRFRCLLPECEDPDEIFPDFGLALTKTSYNQNYFFDIFSSRCLLYSYP